MMLRMLLVLVAVAGLSLGGCQKKEPTAPTDTTPAVEEVEDAAEEAVKE